MNKYNENKKILVAVSDYPNNNGGVSLMFVHTRNLYYIKKGLDITVLNFSAKNDYVYQGINVITLKTYAMSSTKYSILLLHAANIRNHYRFLKKYGKKFKRYVFFYHGHEVLKINKVYSKPYRYLKENTMKKIFQNIYDDYKFYKWRHYLPKVKDKSIFIFVSNWMKDEFFRWIKINPNLIDDKCSITYNSVGELFEKEKFDEKCSKKYDFITVRSNLDGSKYAVDIVNRIADNTPHKKFLVVGKGRFFDYYKKAKNIEWINKTLNHNELIDLLQKSRFALMPTRTDAQGLMMCEMASFGIPVITSDIPVCHEVFKNFENAYYIDNDNLDINLSEFDNKMSKCIKLKEYYRDKTVSNEIKIFVKLFNAISKEEKND